MALANFYLALAWVAGVVFTLVGTVAVGTLVAHLFSRSKE